MQQYKKEFISYFLECNNRKGSWIDQEIIRLEKDLDKVEFHLERSSLSKIQRKSYTKKRNSLRLFLERAEVTFQRNNALNYQSLIK